MDSHILTAFHKKIYNTYWHQHCCISLAIVNVHVVCMILLEKKSQIRYLSHKKNMQIQMQQFCNFLNLPICSFLLMSSFVYFYYTRWEPIIKLWVWKERGIMLYWEATDTLIHTPPVLFIGGAHSKAQQSLTSCFFALFY